MLSTTLFQQAYIASGESIKAIIDSSVISDCVESSIPGLPEEQKKYLRMIVAHYLLGTINDQTTPQVIAEYNLPITLGHVMQIQSCCIAAKIPAQKPEEPAEIETSYPVSQSSDGTNIYSSTQDAVLNPVPQNPNPPTIDSPKWGQL
jgi:hypothetical protein